MRLSRGLVLAEHSLHSAPRFHRACAQPRCGMTTTLCNTRLMMGLLRAGRVRKATARRARNYLAPLIWHPMFQCTSAVGTGLSRCGTLTRLPAPFLPRRIREELQVPLDDKLGTSRPLVAAATCLNVPQRFSSTSFLTPSAAACRRRGCLASLCAQNKRVSVGDTGLLRHSIFDRPLCARELRAMCVRALSRLRRHTLLYSYQGGVGGGAAAIAGS